MEKSRSEDEEQSAGPDAIGGTDPEEAAARFIPDTQDEFASKETVDAVDTADSGPVSDRTSDIAGLSPGPGETICFVDSTIGAIVVKNAEGLLDAAPYSIAEGDQATPRKNPEAEQGCRSSSSVHKVATAAAATERQPTTVAADHDYTNEHQAGVKELHQRESAVEEGQEPSVPSYLDEQMVSPHSGMMRPTEHSLTTDKEVIDQDIIAEEDPSQSSSLGDTSSDRLFIGGSLMIAEGGDGDDDDDDGDDGTAAAEHAEATNKKDPHDAQSDSKDVVSIIQSTDRDEGTTRHADSPAVVCLEDEDTEPDVILLSDSPPGTPSEIATVGQDVCRTESSDEVVCLDETSTSSNKVKEESRVDRDADAAAREVEASDDIVCLGEVSGSSKVKGESKGDEAGDGDGAAIDAEASDDVVCLGESNSSPDPLQHKPAVLTLFSCPYPECSMQFMRKDAFILHLSSHGDFSVKKQVSLAKTKLSFNQDNYRCDTCQFLSEYREVFAEHLRHHVLKSPYSCTLCTIKFSKLSEGIAHFYRYHKGAEFSFSPIESPVVDAVMRQLGPQAPARDGTFVIQKSKEDESGAPGSGTGRPPGQTQADLPETGTSTSQVQSSSAQPSAASVTTTISIVRRGMVLRQVGNQMTSIITLENSGRKNPNQRPAFVSPPVTVAIGKNIKCMGCSLTVENLEELDPFMKHLYTEVHEKSSILAIPCHCSSLDEATRWKSCPFIMILRHNIQQMFKHFSENPGHRYKPKVSRHFIASDGTLTTYIGQYSKSGSFAEATTGEATMVETGATEGAAVETTLTHLPDVTAAVSTVIDLRNDETVSRDSAPTAYSTTVINLMGAKASLKKSTSGTITVTAVRTDTTDSVAGATTVIDLRGRTKMSEANKSPVEQKGTVVRKHTPSSKSTSTAVDGEKSASTPGSVAATPQSSVPPASTPVSSGQVARPGAASTMKASALPKTIADQAATTSLPSAVSTADTGGDHRPPFGQVRVQGKLEARSILKIPSNISRMLQQARAEFSTFAHKRDGTGNKKASPCTPSAETVEKISNNDAPEVHASPAAASQVAKSPTNTGMQHGEGEKPASRETSPNHSESLSEEHRVQDEDDDEVEDAAASKQLQFTRIRKLPVADAPSPVPASRSPSPDVEEFMDAGDDPSSSDEEGVKADSRKPFVNLSSSASIIYTSPTSFGVDARSDPVPVTLWASAVSKSSVATPSLSELKGNQAKSLPQEGLREQSGEATFNPTSATRDGEDLQSTCSSILDQAGANVPSEQPKTSKTKKAFRRKKAAKDTITKKSPKEVRAKVTTTTKSIEEVKTLETKTKKSPKEVKTKNRAKEARTKEKKTKKSPKEVRATDIKNKPSEESKANKSSTETKIRKRKRQTARLSACSEEDVDVANPIGTKKRRLNQNEEGWKSLSSEGDMTKEQTPRSETMEAPVIGEPVPSTTPVYPVVPVQHKPPTKPAPTIQVPKRYGVADFQYQNGLYKCLKCKQQWSREKLFNKHIWGHLHSMPMACNHCPEGITFDKFSHCILMKTVVDVMRQANYFQHAWQRKLNELQADQAEPGEQATGVTPDKTVEHEDEENQAPRQEPSTQDDTTEVQSPRRSPRSNLHADSQEQLVTSRQITHMELPTSVTTLSALPVIPENRLLDELDRFEPSRRPRNPEFMDMEHLPLPVIKVVSETAWQDKKSMVPNPRQCDGNDATTGGTSQEAAGVLQDLGAPKSPDVSPTEHEDDSMQLQSSTPMNAGPLIKGNMADSGLNTAACSARLNRASKSDETVLESSMTLLESKAEHSAADDNGAPSSSQPLSVDDPGPSLDPPKSQSAQVKSSDPSVWHGMGDISEDTSKKTIPLASLCKAEPALTPISPRMVASGPTDKSTPAPEPDGTPSTEPSASTETMSVPFVEPSSLTETDLATFAEPSSLPKPEAICSLETEPISSTEPSTQPETEAVPSAEPSTQLETEPISSAEPSPLPETEAISSAEPSPLPQTEAISSAEPSPLPETEAISSAEPSPLPQTEAISSAEPSPLPQTEAISSAEPSPLPETEAISSAEPSPLPQTEAISSAEPSPLPETELISSAEPSPLPESVERSSLSICTQESIPSAKMSPTAMEAMLPSSSSTNMHAAQPVMGLELASTCMSDCEATLLAKTLPLQYKKLVPHLDSADRPPLWSAEAILAEEPAETVYSDVSDTEPSLDSGGNKQVSEGIGDDDIGVIAETCRRGHSMPASVKSVTGPYDDISDVSQGGDEGAGIARNDATAAAVSAASPFEVDIARPEATDEPAFTRKTSDNTELRDGESMRAIATEDRIVVQPVMSDSKEMLSAGSATAAEGTSDDQIRILEPFGEANGANQHKSITVPNTTASGVRTASSYTGKPRSPTQASDLHEMSGGQAAVDDAARLPEELVLPLKPDESMASAAGPILSTVDLNEEKAALKEIKDEADIVSKEVHVDEETGEDKLENAIASHDADIGRLAQQEDTVASCDADISTKQEDTAANQDADAGHRLQQEDSVVSQGIDNRQESPKEGTRDGSDVHVNITEASQRNLHGSLEVTNEKKEKSMEKSPGDGLDSLQKQESVQEAEQAEEQEKIAQAMVTEEQLLAVTGPHTLPQHQNSPGLPSTEMRQKAEIGDIRSSEVVSANQDVSSDARRDTRDAASDVGDVPVESAARDPTSGNGRMRMDSDETDSHRKDVEKLKEHSATETGLKSQSFLLGDDVASTDLSAEARREDKTSSPSDESEPRQQEHEDVSVETRLTATSSTGAPEVINTAGSRGDAVRSRSSSADPASVATDSRASIDNGKSQELQTTTDPNVEPSTSANDRETTPSTLAAGAEPSGASADHRSRADVDLTQATADVICTEGEEDSGNEADDDAESERCSRLMPYERDTSRPSGAEMAHIVMQQRQQQSHVMSSSSKFLYKCGFDGCDFKTIDPDSFKIHNLLKHVKDNVEYPCSYCCKLFSSDAELLQHQEVHKANVYKCSFAECSYGTKKLPEFRTHMESEHFGAAHYPCCFCEKLLDDVEKVVSHVDRHVQSQVKCPYCNLKSTQKREIQQHIGKSHPSLPKKIVVSLHILPEVDDDDDDNGYDESGAGTRTQNGNCENGTGAHVTGNVIKIEPGVFSVVEQETGRTSADGSARTMDETPFSEASEYTDVSQLMQMRPPSDMSFMAIKQEAGQPQDRLTGSGGNRSDTPASVSSGGRLSVDSQSSIIAAAALPALGMESFMSWSCSQCSFVSSSAGALLEHTPTHSYPQDRSHNFLCKECQFSSNSADDFLIHLQFHRGSHTVRFYCCAHCNFRTTNMPGMEDHLSDAHPDDDFKFEVSQEKVNFMQMMIPCPMCNAPLLQNDEEAKRQHIMAVHGEKELMEYVLKNMMGGGPGKGGGDAGGAGGLGLGTSLAGLLCSGNVGGSSSSGGTSNQNQGTQGQQQNNGSQITRFHCDVCEFSTNESAIFREHYTLHGVDAIDDISGCSGSVSQDMMNVDGTGQIIGTLSSAVFPDSMGSPTDETFYPEDDGTMVYECTICPFQTLNHMLFEAHLAAHQSGEKRAAGIGGGKVYRCELCPYWTSIAKYLWRHKKVHKSGPVVPRSKSFQCGYCNYKCTRMQAVSWHINRYHPGKERKYFHNNKLNIKAPSPKKPVRSIDGYFHCERCPYKNQNPKYILRHITKTHEREYKGIYYKCGYCKYTCPWRKTMSWHINRYHPGKEKRFTELDQPSLCTPQEVGEDCNLEAPGEDKSDVDGASPKYSSRMEDYFQASLENGIYLYSCQKCKYSTKYFKFMRRHVKKHMHKKLSGQAKDLQGLVFKCGYCKYTCKYKKTVSWHINRYHPGKDKKINEVHLPSLTRYGGNSSAAAAASASKNHTYMPLSSSTPVARPHQPAALTSPTPSAAAMAVPTGNQPMMNEAAISEFERTLPNTLVYLTPIKCPMCTYETKVKYNLLRHLNCHRQSSHLLSQPLQASTTSASDILEDLVNSSIEGSDMGSSIVYGDSYGSGLSGGEVASHMSATGSSYVDPVSLDSWEQYCSKTSAGLYRCKACEMENRYVSRVMRHYRIKHLKLMAFRCGYCSYEAVEQWMVKKHCMSTHPQLPMSLHHQVRAPVKGGLDPPVDEVEEQEEDDYPDMPELTYAPSEQPPYTGQDAEGVGAGGSEYAEVEEIRSYDGENAEKPIDRTYWTVDLLDKFIEKGESAAKSKCKFCGYHADKAAVKRHICARHLKVFPFVCKYCKFCYVEFNKVRKHIEQSHPGAPNVVLRKNLKSLLERFRHESVESISMRADLRFTDSLSVDSPQKSSCMQDTSGEFAVPVAPPLLAVKPEPVLPSGSVPMASEKLDGIAPGKKVKKIFKCIYCGYASVWNLVDVRRHIVRKHFGRSSYMCYYCSVKSVNVGTVRKHIKKCHPRKPVKVRDSYEDLNRVVPLQEEDYLVVFGMLGDDGAPLLEPSKDSNSPPTEGDKETSQKTMPPEIVEEIIVSPKADLSMQKISDHSSKEFRGAFYRCKSCGVQKRGPSIAKEHVLMKHFKLKPYQCPHCGDTFWKKSNGVDHLLTVHGDTVAQPHQTIHAKEAELLVHIERVPPSEVGVYTSDKKPVIGKARQVSASDQAPSSSSSASEGSFQCDMCSYATSDMHNFDAHVQMHFRNYQCSYCEFESKIKSSVQKHSLMKHRDKPVKIKTSLKPPGEETTSGAGGANVKAHESQKRSHSAASRGAALSPGRNMALQCTMCNVRFETALFLDQHMISHLIYGPFKCSHCGVVIGYKDKMLSHNNEHHPDQALEFSLVKAKLVSGDATSSQTKAGAVDVDQVSMCSSASREEDHDEASGSEATMVGLKGCVQYLCQVCKVTTSAIATLRHHVMTHFDYRPYRCPYCPTFGSVRSYPIKKHIRSVHSGFEEKYDFRKDDKMEVIVSNSMAKAFIDENNQEHIYPAYTASGAVNTGPPRKKIKQEPVKSVAKSKVAPSKPMPIKFNFPKKRAPELSPTHKRYSSLGKPRTAHLSPNKPKYSCPICSAPQGSPVHLRRHLMREIEYKPYLCTLCSFREINMSGIKAHFQRKHSSVQQVKVIHRRHVQKEARIEELMNQVMGKVKQEREEAPIIMEDVESEPGHIPKLKLKINLKPSTPRKSKTVAKKSTTQRSPSGTFQVTIPKPSKDGRLRCKHCGWRTKQEKVFYMHLRRHGPKNWRCAYCDFRDVFRSAVGYHQRSKHPELENNMIYDPVNSTDDPPEASEAQLHGSSSSGDDEEDEAGVSTHSSHDKAAWGYHGSNQEGAEDEDEVIIQDEEGLFRCPFCDYARDKEGFVRMHMARHLPATMVCKHCGQKFKLLYKLRKHCLTVHPGSPLAWEDLTTGKSIVEPSMGSSDTPDGCSAGADAPNRSEAQDPAWSLQYCCHACPYKVASVPDLLFHVELFHSLGAQWRREQLKSMGSARASSQDQAAESTDPERETPNTALCDNGNGVLSRCGFCSFSTFFEAEFREHLSTHTLRKPFKCAYCDAKAFHRSEMKRHWQRNHVGFPFEYIQFDQSQPAVADDETTQAPLYYSDEVQDQHRHTEMRHPMVMLWDVLGFPSEEMAAMLKCYGVSSFVL